MSESPLIFPEDHGKHGSHLTEWWYFSGNLVSDDCSQWDYHFVVFRRGIGLGILPGRDSSLFDAFVAHMVITRSDDASFRFLEQYGSSLFGFAGANKSRMRLWVGDWEIDGLDGAIRLSAGNSQYGLDLRLVPLKPIVLNGRNGLAQKGPSRLNATYHYSIPMLGTTGTCNWEGCRFAVAGKSWFDREFGTDVFPETIEGWDWFCMRLDNGHEIMLFSLRAKGKSESIHSYGTVVLPGGDYHTLTFDDFSIVSKDVWNSPRTKASYPLNWEVRIPRFESILQVKPVSDEHEHVTSWITLVGFDYWEGPVRVAGMMNGSTVNGRGHAELTGYAQPIGGRF